MKTTLPLLLVVAAVVSPSAVAAADPVVLSPWESAAGFEPQNAIDTCVLKKLEKRGIRPANLCSDAVFLRRVFVDVTGTLPDPQLVRRFLNDERPDKRAALVDAVLESDAYVDYWTLKWGDLLRVKAEFPINLWPNGVQAYHRWIRDAVRENRPYDEFARALLTSSGSNFRVPPVNFYRAVQNRAPETLAAAAALTFMGARFERWPEDRRAGMAAFFSRIAFKQTAEWKEEVVILDPAPTEPLDAVFPDGVAVRIPAMSHDPARGADPRGVFADWLLAPDNPWFARCIANRVWSWLLGRGVIHEPDDIGPDNPPSNPELLACLERELVAAEYDLKSLFRLILNSRTYQASPVPQSDHPEAEALFSHYIVRRLDAEVLIDALCRLNGRGQDYVSTVPEPFTYLPNMVRTVKLSDGTITSSFLETFGRPARDTGLESERDNDPTGAQRLFLLNSSEIQQRIEKSAWLRQITSSASANFKARGKGRAKNKAERKRQWATQRAPVRAIYAAILSRDPTPAEVTAAVAYFRRESGKKPRDAAVDLIWALVNTKEFLYRH